MRIPQQPQIPDLEAEQLIFSLLLSFNLSELGAFAWQEYQRLGRGFVVIDQVQPYAIYVPRSFVTEVPGDAPHFSAAFEQIGRYAILFG